MRFIPKLIRITCAMALAGVAGAGAAQASGLEALETFMRNAKSGQAEFTQVVTAPAREGQAGRSKTSSGSFAFERPNRFRFAYRKPYEETIVADGQTLWLHDVDLNQVTTRRQAQALGSTPAAVIASSPDLQALRKDFDLAEAPDRDGLQWVLATPRNKDGQLSRVQVGFRGNELAALEILDSFGQRSVMTFNKMQVNGALPADTFNFRVPKGADVIRQ